MAKPSRTRRPGKRKQDRPEIWSFFTGSMGLDLGLERANLHTTLAVEIDRTCCETIKTNRPDVVVLNQSVSELSSADLRAATGFSGDVFLMAGGPPCQSFSPGGKRAALSDPRGNLIYEYLRLIAEVRPRFFALENVANLVTAALRHRPIDQRPGKHWSLKAYETGRFDNHDDAPPLEADELSGSAVRQLLADLKSVGYQVTFGVLDAADYGAPQHRLRFVMLGSRDGETLVLPRPTYGPLSPRQTPFRTVRDAIADLLAAPGDHSVYTDRTAQYFSQVPEGKNWRALPESVRREALGPAFDSGGGKTGFFRRLAWDSPSPTVTGRANRKASATCHPTENRPLSVKECARLQGFPDDWRFVGSMAAIYMQVGNAVPVALGAAIATSFAPYATPGRDSKPSQAKAEGIDVMLDRAVQRLRASARNTKSRETVPAPGLPFEDCPA